LFGADEVGAFQCLLGFEVDRVLAEAKALLVVFPVVVALAVMAADDTLGGGADPGRRSGSDGG
jgi:hypothetical protein